MMTASMKSDENALSQSTDHGILIWLDNQFDQRIHIFETNEQNV